MMEGPCAVTQSTIGSLESNSSALKTLIAMIFLFQTVFISMAEVDAVRILSFNENQLL